MTLEGKKKYDASKYTRQNELAFGKQAASGDRTVLSHTDSVVATYLVEIARLQKRPCCKSACLCNAPDACAS